MPICSVPPSTTVRATCSPPAYSVKSIGSRGGANSGKSGRPFQQHVEFAGRDVGIARHERQLGIDLPREQEIALAARAQRQQVEREVGIAAQAQAGLAAALPFGDELRDHVDAPLEQIAKRMRVVGGNIVALRRCDPEPRAGLEEEFVDLDIGRKRAGVQRSGIGEVGIAAEHALRERRDEAPLEAGPRARLLERQRCEDSKMDRRIGRGAREQGIGDVIGLAEPERQSEHDLLADAGDDRLGETIGVVEPDRTAAATHQVRWFQSGSGRKRSP